MKKTYRIKGGSAAIVALKSYAKNGTLFDFMDERKSILEKRQSAKEKWARERGLK